MVPTSQRRGTPHPRVFPRAATAALDSTCNTACTCSSAGVAFPVTFKTKRFLGFSQAGWQGADEACSPLSSHADPRWPLQNVLTVAVLMVL